MKHPTTGEDWPAGVATWAEQRRAVGAGEHRWADYPAKWRAPHAVHGTMRPPPPRLAAAPPVEGRSSPPPPAGATSAREGLEAARAALPGRRPARGRQRGPSGRYLLVTTEGEWLYAAGGTERAACPPLEGLEAEVRRVWPVVPEVIVYAHELAPWGPEHLERLGWRKVGETGAWWTSPSRVHVYLPAVGGDWRGTGGPVDLLHQVEAFRDGVGFAWAFSGASTVHRLIGALVPTLGPPLEHPPLEGTADSAWRIPAHAWSFPGRGYDNYPVARAFDRSGSYLSAWRGTLLADGPWELDGPGLLEPGPEWLREPAYYQVDAPWLAEVVPEAMPNPFDRVGHGPVWLTTPLAQLAAELAAQRDGPRLEYSARWVATGHMRGLDSAGKRLGEARAALEAGGHLTAARALKAAYAAATAWLEWGPGPGAPLHRPDWRRTVVDRFVANTWRGLERVWPPPLALSGIDCAIMLVRHPRAAPAGLKLGTGLGEWKPKGEAVPAGEVLELVNAGDVRGAMKRLGAA